MKTLDMDLQEAMDNLVEVAKSNTRSEYEPLKNENARLIRENYEMRRALRQILFMHVSPASNMAVHNWGGVTGNAIINEWKKLAGIEVKDTNTLLVA